MSKQIISEEFKRMQKLAGLINEETDWNLLRKYVDELSNYVTRPDLYKNDFPTWEKALFNDDYNDEENEIEIPEDEYNNLRDELNNNFNFNYFVRNWTVLDDEQSRHEDEINKDIEYFKTEYNVDDKIANIMKKIVDNF